MLTSILVAVPAQWIQAAYKGSVRMDTASGAILEITGAVLFLEEVDPTILGVFPNELSGGNSKSGSKS